MSRQDDHDEFVAFAQARSRQLYRAAWLLTGDSHAAEDLVQETLAKVYARWCRPLRGGIDNPVAYAHTTLTRTFISSRRKRSSGERPTEHLPETAGADEGELSVLRLSLLEALEGLSPLDRTVVVLRYLDDLSVEEVADVVGSTSNAVRTRSSRALAKLRPLLDESFHPVPRPVSRPTQEHP